MTPRPRFERKSVGWVLNRTRSCFAPLIEQRMAAGETVCARAFAVDGRQFAQVLFTNPAFADLVLSLEVRR